MPRLQFVNAIATSLLSALVVNVICCSALGAAPRNTFPGRRIGGGTRGECAARPVLHLVPSSNVFSPGEFQLDRSVGRAIGQSDAVGGHPASRLG